MCGRMAIGRAAGDLVAALDIPAQSGEAIATSYNVAPTSSVPIVLRDAKLPDAPLSLVHGRWGLIPAWSKQVSGPPLINARAETVTVKPTFKSAARRRRGLVPADGYYEWQSGPAGKQPYYLNNPETGLFFAAIYDFWRPLTPAGEERAQWSMSLAVLTTTATDTLGHIHDRSPVIVPSDRVEEWLDPTLEASLDVEGFLASLPEPRLTANAVSTRVNSVKNDGPELIAPVT